MEMICGNCTKYVHPWFHEAIYYILRTKNKKFTLVNRDFESNECEDKDLLGRFGGEIKNLIIESGTERILTGLVHSKYWSRGNIENCTFRGLSRGRWFFLSEVFVYQNINLFKSLKSLTLDEDARINEETFLKILEASKQLKELRIFNDCCISERILNVISNYQMEEFHFPFRELRECPVNTTIKNLRCCTLPSDTAFFKHFPNVERLQLGIINNNEFIWQPILSLTNLTALSLNLGPISESKLFVFLSPLAEANLLSEFILEIPFSRVTRTSESPEIINVLCKMTKLRMLKLRTGSFSKCHLFRLAKELKELRVFGIQFFELVYGDDPSDLHDCLCKFVSDAKNLVKLKFGVKWRVKFEDDIRQNARSKNVLNVAAVNPLKIISLNIRTKWVDFYNIKHIDM